MDPANDLQFVTTKYFDTINFSELNDRWIDEVINNDFTDVEENNITLSVLFVNDPAQTLNKLSETCNLWCQKETEDVSPSVNISDVNNSLAEEMLWTVLDEMDVSIKQIQSLIYLLCSNATKKSSQEDIALGLGSAKFYFNLLRVPGSGAYSVYHSSLFQLCINSLLVPDFTSDKDSSSQRQFEKLTVPYISTLISLIPLLKNFHLGEDSCTIEKTIEKLVEITTCEVQKHINFSINYSDLGHKELIRRNKPSFNAAALAFQVLSTIISNDVNGDRDQNYNAILSFLNKSILCYKARKSQTISQKHLLVKDNAVRFICHNLQSQEFCSEVTQIAIKRLCLGVSDKTEFRNTVSLAVIDILLKLKDEHVTEMVKWFLLLIDSNDTKDRMFSLDLLGHLLSIVNEDISSSPECFKNDSFYASVIFAILTRCDDVSPNVRTKALAVLSQNMQCIFNFLDKTKDLTTFEVEDEFDGDIDVNGTHRYFWYNMTSFRERLNEIAAILQRRVEDNNVTARKAALVALENLMVFDVMYINDENLKFFEAAAKDTNILVKKQMIQSLTSLLDAYFNKSEIQESWIKCIFPLVQDPETTVQSAALLALEKQILQKLFSSIQANRECAFTLLKLLSSDEFLAHQRYLQKAFGLWKGENKLKPQTIVHFEKYVETEYEECVWFFISHFALYSSVPSKISQCCVERFEKLHGDYPLFMKYILKVLKHIFGSLPTESLERVQSIICENLESYTIPVEFIDMYIELLFKIHKHWETQPEFEKFSKKVIKKCEQHLSKIRSEKSFSGIPSEILLPKYFCTIKEFCHFCAANITPNIISLLKAFSASVELPEAFLKILSPGLKAHAFAALGKICLQDEILAKEVLPVYAKELLTSKHNVIRNNIVVILIEMCKRYTSFADKYVPLICLCFKDTLYLIRYQTIVLIVNLLQEDYIKWRGPLFFCLLSSLIDKQETIQELARYSLCQLLHDKKRSLFSEHFIDSIFVFNHFPPPDNETVAQSVRDLERFAIPGENRREERIILYKFLLDSMEPKERAYLIRAICEIMMSIAETVYPLNETTECMIRDCFEILTSKEIRAYNLEQLDELDEEKESDFYKTELDMRKVVIIEPLIPVIVSLRNGITDPESDLMHDIILFLKELLHDFRDSLKDILATDKILYRQLELEIKNDAERERTGKKVEKELKDKNRQNSVELPEGTAHAPLTLQGIQTMMKEVSKIAEARESDEGEQNDPKPSSSQQTPKTSSQTSRYTRHSQSISPENRNIANISNAGVGSPQSVTFNIATDNPTEANEIQRLASTPRLVLTKLPMTADILDVSEIAPEPMNVDDSEDS